MLQLRIVSPEKIEFTGEVESVKVPGTQGNFEILSGHAPIISTLQKGVVEYDGVQLPILGDGLFGILEGDVQEPLEAIEAQAGSTPCGVEVDCSLLIRLDFVAAGGLLNWAASMQGKGYRLRFVNLHQLTAAFMHVIGVQEHAKLMLRAV